MTRLSKQNERRQKSPRKHRLAGVKTGPRKDKLERGYREHLNAVENSQGLRFVPVVGSAGAAK